MSGLNIGCQDSEFLTADAETVLRDLARLAARYGYSVVPDEPASTMINAGGYACQEHCDLAMDAAEKAYRAMVQTGRVKP